MKSYQQSNNKQTIIVDVCGYKCKCACLWSDFTIYTPGIGTLSYSLISSRKNSSFAHFATAIASHYNLAFLFQQVPITAGWRDAASYERLAQTPLHMAGSVTQTPIIHSSTNQARRCLTLMT